MQWITAWKRYAATGSAVLCASVLLGGCAMVNDWMLRLGSSDSDAYAVIDGRLLTGYVRLSPNRTGRVVLGSDVSQPACTGTLRYSSSTQGMMDLRCNHTGPKQLQVVILTPTRAYAYEASLPPVASTNTTPSPPSEGWVSTPKPGGASLVFGLSEAEATAYLLLPPGKKWGIHEIDGSLLLQ